MLKVLKYDWRNGWNNVKLTLLVAAIFTILTGIFFGQLGAAPVASGEEFGLYLSEENMNTAVVVLSVTWFSIMMALLVLTVDAIVRNMSSRMFGPEGYLTHTLPVHTWELLAGKALGTWIFGVFMVGVALFSIILLLIATAAGSGSVGDIISLVFTALPKLGPVHMRQILSGAGLLLYSIAAFLAWSLMAVVQFQFICIAARLFGKFHVAGGVFVFTILMILEDKVDNGMTMGFLVTLLISAACFYGSHLLLKKRLSV